MFHNYKLIDDGETMLVNTCFFDDEDIEYANKHRFNIRYTEVRNTGFAEDMSKLLDVGYTFKFIKEPDITPDGTVLPKKISALFIHKDNNKEVQKEKMIIVEILNYLICLSRIASPSDAAKYFGFEFDGAHIDLFREIKKDFYSGNLNIEAMLNNKVYKDIIKQLNNMEGII